MLWVHGDSKRAAITLVATGACTMFLATVLCVLGLYSVSIGAYTTITGCVFMIFTGLLFQWRMRLDPEQPLVANKMTAFQTYLVKRVLASLETLFGASLLIYWLIYIQPWHIRLFFYLLRPLS
jgi:hypothetical protein